MKVYSVLHRDFVGFEYECDIFCVCGREFSASSNEIGVNRKAGSTLLYYIRAGALIANRRCMYDCFVRDKKLFSRA